MCAPRACLASSARAASAKSSRTDLLDFAHLFTIIVIILAMVTAIDQLSAWLRRSWCESDNPNT